MLAEYTHHTKDSNLSHFYRSTEIGVLRIAQLGWSVLPDNQEARSYPLCLQLLKRGGTINFIAPSIGK